MQQNPSPTIDITDPNTIATIALSCDKITIQKILFTDKYYMTAAAQTAIPLAISRLSAEPSLTSQQKSILNILKETLEIVEISKTIPKEITPETIDTPARLNPTRTERITVNLKAASSGYKLHFTPYEEPLEPAIQPTSAKKMRVEEREKE
jgi:hypothetical protein